MSLQQEDVVNCLALMICQFKLELNDLYVIEKFTIIHSER
jgi:hypothetical protein